MQILLHVRRIFFSRPEVKISAECKRQLEKLGWGLPLPSRTLIRTELLYRHYIFVEVEPSDKVAKLKAVLEKVYNILPNKKCLTYRGRVLREGDTIADSRIGEGSIVTGIVRVMTEPKK